MAITSPPTQWFLWISGLFIMTKTRGKTPTPLIQVCAKMTAATTKITMSHSVIHVNKDESFRHINKIHYRLHLEHMFYICWHKTRSKIYYLQKNVTFFFYTNCKLKNNQNYKLKKISFLRIYFQYLFLFMFFRTVPL